MSKMTQSEFLKIFHDYKEYDDKNINELIVHTLWLVDEFINKYNALTDEKEELYTWALEGLWQALKNYDETKNIPFSTFAYVCMRNNVSKLIMFNQRALKRNNLNENEVLGLEPNVINDYEEKELVETIYKLINEIKDERNKQIMQLYFKTDNNTQDDIAKKFNISKSRVCEIIKMELKRIKKELYHLGLLNINNYDNRYNNYNNKMFATYFRTHPQNVYDLFRQPRTGKMLDSKVADLLISELNETQNYILQKYFNSGEAKNIVEHLLCKLKSVTSTNVYDEEPDRLINLYQEKYHQGIRKYFKSPTNKQLSKKVVEKLVIPYDYLYKIAFGNDYLNNIKITDKKYYASAMRCINNSINELQKEFSQSIFEIKEDELLDKINNKKSYKYVKNS